jgi:bifunctional non-homologous end joining protein LigD
MKWDGMRAVCRIVGGRVELYSRNRNNISACYPELTEALAQRAHGTDMIVDGEIVAPDPATGAPSFVRLQQRMHLTRPARELVQAVTVELFVFDLLESDGVGTWACPMSSGAPA